MAALPVLAALEARVLGVLVEKQHTVPDSYPLTLNALLSGANQKTSRDPVMHASEAQVQEALDRLRSLDLVMESSGGRTMRYAQNLGKAIGVPPQSVALLAALLLRGAQTAGELRINTERLHRFGDILAVEAFLGELAERALVRELPRAAGSREARWMHLLSGEPVIAPEAAGAEHERHEAGSSGEIERIRDELEALRSEVAALKAAVARLANPGTGNEG